MAITVTVASLITRLPEFAEVDPVKIQLAIDEAIARVNETQWSAKADLGVSYLAAHLIAFFYDPDCVEPEPGVVTSEREGGVAATYAIADHMKDAGALGSTKYGRHFVTLRREIFVTRVV